METTGPELFTIYCVQGAGEFYIGCTNNFNRRMNDHRLHIKACKIFNSFYQFVRNNGGWDAFEKSVIESKVMTKEEALLRETELIRILRPNLNMTEGSIEPSVRIDIELFREKGLGAKTPEEMLLYKRAYNRMWREANGEKYNAYLKEYRRKNPSKVGGRYQYKKQVHALMAMDLF